MDKKRQATDSPKPSPTTQSRPQRQRTTEILSVSQLSNPRLSKSPTESLVAADTVITSPKTILINPQASDVGEKATRDVQKEGPWIAALPADSPTIPKGSPNTLFLSAKQAYKAACSSDSMGPSALKPVIEELELELLRQENLRLSVKLAEFAHALSIDSSMIPHLVEANLRTYHGDWRNPGPPTSEDKDFGSLLFKVSLPPAPGPQPASPAPEQANPLTFHHWAPQAKRKKSVSASSVTPRRSRRNLARNAKALPVKLTIDTSRSESGVPTVVPEPPHFSDHDTSTASPSTASHSAPLTTSPPHTRERVHSHHRGLTHSQVGLQRGRPPGYYPQSPDNVGVAVPQQITRDMREGEESPYGIAWGAFESPYPTAAPYLELSGYRGRRGPGPPPWHDTGAQGGLYCSHGPPRYPIGMPYVSMHPTMRGIRSSPSTGLSSVSLVHPAYPPPPRPWGYAGPLVHFEPIETHAYRNAHHRSRQDQTPEPPLLPPHSPRRSPP